MMTSSTFEENLVDGFFKRIHEEVTSDSLFLFVCRDVKMYT